MSWMVFSVFTHSPSVSLFALDELPVAPNRKFKWTILDGQGCPAEEDDLVRSGVAPLAIHDIYLSSLRLAHPSHLNKLCLVLLEPTQEVLTLFVVLTVRW
jgi:hypothetical protein